MSYNGWYAMKPNQIKFFLFSTTYEVWSKRNEMEASKQKKKSWLNPYTCQSNVYQCLHV